MTHARNLAAAIAALLPISALAQLAVSATLAHSTLLRNEPMPLTITIRNDADIPFIIRSTTEDKEARVRLIIDKGQDRYAGPLQEEPLLASLALLPGEQQRVSLDVEKWYDVSAAQGYSLRVMADWNGKSYSSAILHFDVVEGLPLVSVVRGLPGESERLRRYTLRCLARERSEHIFLCIDEDDGLVNCGVFDLGPVIRVFQPRLEVGRDGRITVLHQSANRWLVKSLLKSWPDRVTLVDQVPQKQGESAEGAAAPAGRAP